MSTRPMRIVWLTLFLSCFAFSQSAPKPAPLP